MIVTVSEWHGRWAVILKKSVDELLDDEHSTSNDMIGDPIQTCETREDAEKYGREFAQVNDYVYREE